MMGSITREEIRERLTGPVASVKTPFLPDGSIDFAGLRNFVDFVIAGGATTIIITVGDSLLTILTDQDIADLTKVVVEQTAGRAMVVAADRYFGTGQSVAFAKYVREIGADILMVLPPDWGYSCTVASLVEHFAAVAEQIPVMVVTNLFIPRGHAFGLEVLQRLREEVPGWLQSNAMRARSSSASCATAFTITGQFSAGGQSSTFSTDSPMAATGICRRTLTLRRTSPRSSGGR